MLQLSARLLSPPHPRTAAVAQQSGRLFGAAGDAVPCVRIKHPHPAVPCCKRRCMLRGQQRAANILPQHHSLCMTFAKGPYC